MKAIIVDDSNFSVTLIQSMLKKKEIEVVATASKVKEAIQAADEYCPDLITMDVTLLDGDGIDCAKEIKKRNQQVQILIVSSMKDDEIQKRAKEAGAMGYLQKPINEEEFFSALDRVFFSDALFKMLQENYKDAFQEAMLHMLQQTIQGKIDAKESRGTFNIRKSLGVSVAIGIIGRHSGRMILDMKNQTLKNLYTMVAEDKKINKAEGVIFISEFANMVAGNAASLLNQLNRGFGLRVAPPTVFGGKDIVMSLGEIENKTVIVNTDAGEIFMNIGFKKGDEVWMQNLSTHF